VLIAAFLSLNPNPTFVNLFEPNPFNLSRAENPVKKAEFLMRIGRANNSRQKEGKEMKRYLLLTALLIILSGCAFGVYDSRTGFQGAVIGAPYPYYEPYYPDAFYHGYYYKHGSRDYPYLPGRYYRVRAYPRYYR
jgi:hypothetical protein